MTKKGIESFFLCLITSQTVTGIRVENIANTSPVRAGGYVNQQHGNERTDRGQQGQTLRKKAAVLLNMAALTPAQTCDSSPKA